MPNAIKDSIVCETKETAPCAFKIEFTVPTEQVSAAYSQAARNTAKYARIPGFRIGKAPVSMVMTRYASYILEDVERNLQQLAFEKLSENKDDKLDIVAFGRVGADVKPANGSEYKFTMEVETAPAIQLPDYASYQIPEIAADDAEKRIAARLDYMRQLYSEYIPLEGPAVSGDMLKVSYESDFVLPENASPALARAVKSEESWLMLTEPEQIPGMNKALTGAEKGKEYTFEAEFPADWRVAELQGKKVKFTVKIHDGQRRLPISDDDKLAQKVGAENKEKMMEMLQKEAERERENEIREKSKDKMLEFLLEKTPDFVLPEGMVVNVQHREFNRIANQLVRSEADVEPFRKEQEKHLADAKKNAEVYLRKFFIVRAISKKNNIQVTPAEVDAHIRMMCAYTGRKEEEVRKVMAQSGGDVEIQEDILMSKTLDSLVSKK